jgi:catechol 2,3-dioxygenase-like lactoylglutathione lyase family enzyme
MDMNQVTLPSRDVARGAAFYRKLGLVQIVEDLPKYARFELPKGTATLSLHQVDELAAFTGVVVYFECEDLDERVAVLKTAGVVFDSEPADRPWLWREALLRDPDGNVICLFWAGDNRKNPPWRLGNGAV